MQEKELKEYLDKLELATEEIIPQEKLMEELGVSKSFIYRMKIPKYHFPGTKKTFYKRREVVQSLKPFKD